MVRRLIEIGPNNYRPVDSTPESVLADVLADVQAWPQGWEDWPEVVEAHRRLFAVHVIDAQRASTSPPSESRGIVMPIGGDKYFVAGYIALSVLRATGCTLPVEVWQLDAGELDQFQRDTLATLGGITFRVAAEVTPKPRLLTGWGLKPFAVLHSRFREVLLLDADVLAARDPTYLFDAAGYTLKRAMLWPDVCNSQGFDCTETFFAVMGLPCPDHDLLPGHNKPSSYRPVDSGMVLVDRSKCLPEVWLASKLCEHSDFLWPPGRGWLCYGDKSTWLASWFMLAQARGETLDYHAPPFAMPAAGAKFVGRSTGGHAGAFIQHDCDGLHVFTHRCQPQDKWRLNGDNDRLGVPMEDAAFVALDKLRTVVKSSLPPDWWTVRDEMDRTIWREVYVGNEYRLPEKFDPGDAIVDVGAHVGTFAVACLDRGAGHVTCIEPAPANVAGLVQHLARWRIPPQWTAYPVAAIPNDQPPGPMTLLYPEGAQHSGGGVSVPTLAGMCWGVPFDSLLPSGPIRMLKLDCEGAEWELLSTTRRLVDVAEIVGELHNITTQRLADLTDTLQAAGFSVEYRPHVTAQGLGLFFARRPIGGRP